MQTAAPLKQSPPLRTVREAHGLGLRQVAEEAGIDPGQLSRVERGQAFLSVGALHRLARVLGLGELERLLGPYTREGLNDHDPAGNGAVEKAGRGDGRIQV